MRPLISVRASAITSGMKSNAARSRMLLAIASAALLFLLPPFVSAAEPAGRTHLLPHFIAGQVFRYSVQTKIDTTSAASGPIIDAGGSNKLNQSVDVIIRLQIMSASDTPAGPSARIRITYEKAVAASSGPAYDPDVAAMQDQYKKLAGQSFEFTLGGDGKISDVAGLKNIASDPSRAAVLNQWLAQLTLGASLPKQGVAVGEKWSSQQPLENVPLDGLVWKTRATYLRNDPCPAGAQSAAPGGGVPLTPAPSPPDTCAIILTRSILAGGEKPQDRTPTVFRQNGLRTSGVWTGTGEALTAISLRTGMAVSITQTGSTHMDFTIMTATAQNRMRYAGDTHTQSEITLLSQSAIP
ncbi:MAG TPA: hypothetical protein VKS20_11140 [Candidatus Acidoferrales bacterium]|nr:hypothetical protein [Candidatus Acidoferrales bacterium]